jgi:hypothetical protein
VVAVASIRLDEISAQSSVWAVVADFFLHDLQGQLIDLGSGGVCVGGQGGGRSLCALWLALGDIEF